MSLNPESQELFEQYQSLLKDKLKFEMKAEMYQELYNEALEQLMKARQDHLNVLTQLNQTLKKQLTEKQQEQQQTAEEQKPNNIRFTDDQIRHIRNSKSSGICLASQYGVTGSCISAIRHKRIYKHDE